MDFFKQHLAKDRAPIKVGRIITNSTKVIFHNYVTQSMHTAVIEINIAHLKIFKVDIVSLTGNYAYLVKEDMIAILLLDNGVELLMV
jgi:hypothetical protein